MFYNIVQNLLYNKYTQHTILYTLILLFFTLIFKNAVRNMIYQTDKLMRDVLFPYTLLHNIIHSYTKIKYLRYILSFENTYVLN